MTRSPGSHRHWEHASYVGTEVARPSGPPGPGRDQGWGALFTPVLVPAPLCLIPIPVPPVPVPTLGVGWEPATERLDPHGAAGSTGGACACAGTRVRAAGTRALAGGGVRGGAGASPWADGHSLMKRWRWPCQLSPSPWTNGCLTCLWGHKAERVSGPPGWGGGQGGLGTPLLPPSLHSSGGLLPSPRPP